MMLVGIVHMDHLWRRLQVMDEAGNAVLDLALQDTNPYLGIGYWGGKLGYCLGTLVTKIRKNILTN